MISASLSRSPPPAVTVTSAPGDGDDGSSSSPITNNLNIITTTDSSSSIEGRAISGRREERTNSQRSSIGSSSQQTTSTSTRTHPQPPPPPPPRNAAARQAPTVRAQSTDSPQSAASSSKKENPPRGPKPSTLLARRLRYIINQLDRGELSPEDLRKNLEYAALVLETAYIDDSRRILDEDEEAVEFSPEAVPEEVRDWLAATFTRQPAARQKPRFKSVANAIRSGIMFDKIYRRLSTAPQIQMAPAVAEYLKNVNSWEFDVFQLNELSSNTALKHVGLELFQRYNFLAKYKIALPVLEGFLGQLELGYSKHKNPYHNLIHAADVTQTTFWMLSQTGLTECLSELEVFATIFAAMIHDFEHTGHTNNFHIQSNSDYAVLYNDRSVLENHHVSSVFRFMRDSAELSILANLNKEEYREFRNLVVEIVLATDMSTHFAQVKTVKNMLSLPEGIDKVKALCLIVHCCDISHPAKPWRTHNRWTNLVLEEFFRQGDLEAAMGLPYSPLCDRHTTQVAQSQIGFIDFIVEPTLLVCGDMMVKMVEPLVLMPPNDETPTFNSNHLTVSVGGGSTNLNNGEGRRLPLSADGKLSIPQPWLRIIQENKSKWKELATQEELERKKQQEQANNKT